MGWIAFALRYYITMSQGRRHELATDNNPVAVTMINLNDSFFFAVVAVRLR